MLFPVEFVEFACSKFSKGGNCCIGYVLNVLFRICRVSHLIYFCTKKEKKRKDEYFLEKKYIMA